MRQNTIFDQLQPGDHIMYVYKAMPFVPVPSADGRSLDQAFNIHGGIFDGFDDDERSIIRVKTNSDKGWIAWRVPVDAVLQVGTVGDGKIEIVSSLEKGRLS